MKYTKKDREEALESLRMHLKPTKAYPKQTVLQLVRSVSKSGMSRVISTYVSDGQDGLLCLDWAIAVVCGYPLKNQGVRIRGCGTDMGFVLLDSATHRTFAQPYTHISPDLSVSVQAYYPYDANDYNRRWL